MYTVTYVYYDYTYTHIQQHAAFESFSESVRDFLSRWLLYIVAMRSTFAPGMLTGARLPLSTAEAAVSRRHPLAQGGSFEQASPAKSPLRPAVALFFAYHLSSPFSGEPLV